MLQPNKILLRIKFLKKNKRLCNKVFTPKEIDLHHPRGHAHTDWKFPEGRVLIDKARAEIGYSNCTANCDIYWSLLGLYEYLTKEKII